MLHLLKSVLQPLLREALYFIFLPKSVINPFVTHFGQDKVKDIGKTTKSVLINNSNVAMFFGKYKIVQYENYSVSFL